jgi:hypothetical protein
MDKYYFKGKFIQAKPHATSKTFHRFAEYQDDKLNPPIECIVVIEMPNEQSTDNLLLNLIIQNSIGQDIFKLQCKLKNFHVR